MTGVGVHFTHLEVDAPDLWRNKVQFILQNPVEFLDLTFTQEELRPETGQVRLAHTGTPPSQSGQVVTVDLVPGGSRLPVTEENKKSYVAALATHLLQTRVKAQVYRLQYAVYQDHCHIIHVHLHDLGRGVPGGAAHPRSGLSARPLGRGRAGAAPLWG